MNEQEKARLVEELAEAIGIERWSPHGSDTVSNRELATACLPIIDCLLAERDVDAQVSADLAAIMDKRNASVWGIIPTREDWQVILTWPYRGGGTAAPEVYVTGEGPGVMAAIADAVRRAKRAD